MRAKKIDKNQNEIVTDLMKLGYSIDLDHNDFIVGKHRRTKWIEVKKQNPFSKKGKLKKGVIKDSQYKLLWSFKGQYNICWDIGQIIAMFEISPPFFDGQYMQGISSHLFREYYKEWLTESELNRLRCAGIIQDGIKGKDAFEQFVDGL